VVQEYSYKIYFATFGHFYKFLRILEVCTILWELNQLQNDLNQLHSAWPNPARGSSARIDALPHAADRKAGWATAWQPDPAAEANRVVTARSRRAGRCDGAVAEGPMVASRLQGIAGELEGTTGRASGNRSGGWAHRGR
jgi:hypothetical protein